MLRFGREQPAVTDADVVLGRIDPNNFAGGTMQLNRDNAVQALKREVGDPLNLNDTLSALGVSEMVDENMANAARIVGRLRQDVFVQQLKMPVLKSSDDQVAVLFIATGNNDHIIGAARLAPSGKITALAVLLYTQRIPASQDVPTGHASSPGHCRSTH